MRRYFGCCVPFGRRRMRAYQPCSNNKCYKRPWQCSQSTAGIKILDPSQSTIAAEQTRLTTPSFFRTLLRALFIKQRKAILSKEAKTKKLAKEGAELTRIVSVLLDSLAKDA